MSEELSDEEYQQALDDVIEFVIELMRSVSRPAPQMPKMHPGDLGMMTPKEFVASVKDGS
jgi:hypothetical protein